MLFIHYLHYRNHFAIGICIFLPIVQTYLTGTFAFGDFDYLLVVKGIFLRTVEEDDEVFA